MEIQRDDSMKALLLVLSLLVTDSALADWFKIDESNQGATYVDPSYIGHSVSKVISAIEKLIGPSKGEFESTADYVARIKTSLKDRFLSGASIDDFFAFSVPVPRRQTYITGLRYEFDAETGEVKLYANPTSSYFSLSGDDSAYYQPNREETKERDHFETTFTSDVGIAVNRIPFLSFERKSIYISPTIATRFKMQNSRAAVELPALKALIVMKLEHPFVVYKYSEKFLAGNIFAIVYYSGKSGEVFARLPADFGMTDQERIRIAPPPPPPPPQPPPPAPAPAPALPPTVLKNIGVLCPTLIEPKMPRLALQDGTQGVVKAQIVLKGGVVQDVTILSGPRVFHAAVKAAIMQYKCVSDGTDTEETAQQEFKFRFDATPVIQK